jgi:transposase
MTYKLTRKRINQISKAIEKGCTYKLAAASVGISESTLYNWLSEGRKKGTGLHKELLEAIKKAENLRAEFLLSKIIEHSDKDWKACAWLLERRYGYRKDSILEEIPVQQEEIKLETDPKKLLEQQAKDLQQATVQALQSQSYQAYASLQRQLVSVTENLRELQKDEQTEIETMTDEQLISMVENMILSLPPIHRQRLAETIGDNRLKVVK